jgi:hypothetical protein
MSSFYEDISRGLRKNLAKNIPEGSLDMVIDTIEKAFVSEFIVRANAVCVPRKRGFSYGKGYNDAMGDVVKFFNEKYGKTSRLG